MTRHMAENMTRRQSKRNGNSTGTASASMRRPPAEPAPSSTSSTCSPTLGRPALGHIRNYTIGDVTCRYLTHRGYNVMHPTGYDAFGLPAENAAIPARRGPARLDAPQHREHGAPVQAHGLLVRLGARSHHLRPRLLPLEQCASSNSIRPGWPTRRSPGELVPVLPDGAGQRSRSRRQMRALRHPRGQADDGAVVLSASRSTPTACWTATPR